MNCEQIFRLLEVCKAILSALVKSMVSLETSKNPPGHGNGKSTCLIV